jgi:hypothetical protein
VESKLPLTIRVFQPLEPTVVEYALVLVMKYQNQPRPEDKDAWRK